MNGANGKRKSNQKKSDMRDISSYVCKVMVYGAISGHGISRADIESLCERYSDDNPRVDITKLPIVMLTDDGSAEDRAIMSLVKKHCKKCSIFSDDGKTVLIVGLAAKEIVSKLDYTNCEVKNLKTKVRVRLPNRFPINRKMKCFGGDRVCDKIKVKKNRNV